MAFILKSKRLSQKGMMAQLINMSGRTYEIYSVLDNCDYRYDAKCKACKEQKWIRKAKRYILYDDAPYRMK